MANHQDLTAAQNISNPTRAERATHREGRLLRYGSITAALTLSLGASVFREAVGRNLPIEWLLLGLSACAVGFIAGMWERVQRQPRAEVRSALDTQRDILDRLDRIDEAIDAIADHMPECKRLERNRTYAKAVREFIGSPAGAAAPKVASQRNSRIRPVPSESA